MLSAGCSGESCIWLSGAHEPSRWTSFHMEQDCNGAARMFPTDHQRITRRNQECRWDDELEVVLMLTRDLLFMWPSFGRCVLLLLAGVQCNTTWDGWLCWDKTEAGMTTVQSCPDYYHDFDPHGIIITVLPFRTSLADKSRKIVGVTYTVKRNSVWI